MNKIIDRNIAPKIKTPERVDIKDSILVETPLGVKIHNLPFNEYDVVRISLVFNAGTKYQTRPFCASSVISMLSEGCSKYTAQEIAEMLDFYGIFFDVSVDRDNSIITICSLTRFLDKSLDILSALMSAPTFPQKELDIFKTKRKQNIIVQRSKIDYQAREEFAHALYGKTHPYGSSYSETFFDELTREHLIDFFNDYYTRSNVFAVISGNITEEGMTHLKQIIDSLPEGEPKNTTIDSPKTTKLIYKEQKDALQSAIRIGRVMFSREHVDFIGMQVVSTILGGYFGSRLISNLREDKGYTYSIFSGMINFQHNGHLAISSEVDVSKTSASIDEIFYEIKRLQEELVPNQELQMVKNVMIGEIMRILDGPFGIADITIENIQNNTDNKKLQHMIDEIKSMTPERVMELSKRYLNREDFSVVVIGGGFKQ